MMAGLLGAEYTLSVDEVLTLNSRLGIDTTPEVLALWPTQPTIEELERAHDACARALTERELIVDGEIDDDLAHALTVMRRPERDLSIRVITGPEMLRAGVVRHGHTHVVATRRGDTVKVRAFEADSPDRVAAEVCRLLPRAVELRCEAVRAPMIDVAEKLAEIKDATALTDELYGLGAESRSAQMLAGVLADYAAAVEIRAASLDPHSDRSRTVDGAVAVFYSERGSVLSAPSISPDGQLWCSIKGGSGHRIEQAVAQLMSLLPEGW